MKKLLQRLRIIKSPAKLPAGPKDYDDRFVDLATRCCSAKNDARQHAAACAIGRFQKQNAGQPGLDQDVQQLCRILEGARPGIGGVWL